MTLSDILCLLRQLRLRLGLDPIWGARREVVEGIYEGVEE